jgi:hypothetical protein
MIFPHGDLNSKVARSKASALTLVILIVRHDPLYRINCIRLLLLSAVNDS